MTSHRKLAAILSADVAGYSRLMADDEAATVAALHEAQDLFRTKIQTHQGRVIDTAGDSVLAEFASPVEAVSAAAEIQKELSERNASLPEQRRMLYRIGVNLGDVIEEGDILYGDGVNVAARLQELAEPGGISISGTAFDQVEGKLSLAFKFIGEQHVKNITKPVRVYRVVADVPAKTSGPLAGSRRRPIAIPVGVIAVLIVALSIAWTVQRQAEQPPDQDPLLAMPTGPTIAVLPFTNLGIDPRQDYFSDGITEEIITELTRYRTLRVVPRSSTFQYKGKAVDAREVGLALGARYVVGGSVRIARDKIRISAQLVDASDGKNLWAETYDRQFNPNQIFEIQDDIKLRIVATIADTYGVISETGMEQSKRRSSESVVAYECVLRAHAMYRNNYVPPEHFRVRECLERAVQLDPGYADAWAWLAGMYRDEFYHEWNLRSNPVDRAERAARKAIDLEPTNQEAHLVLSQLLLYKRDPGAFDQAERAIALNPNSPDLIAGVAFAYGPAGKWDRGVELAEKAIALTRDPPGWMYIPVHFDHYRKGEFHEALEVALKMKITMGNWYWTYVCLAIDNMELGREAEAKAAIARLLEIEPNFAAKARDRIAFVIWSDDLTNRIVRSLHKAGL